MHCAVCDPSNACAQPLSQARNVILFLQFSLVPYDLCAQRRLRPAWASAVRSMHQSFVTTDPPPPPSGDNDFSTITALLKALYCGDLLRVIALLFISVNSTGYIYVKSQARHLTRYCGRTQKVISPHISLAIPRRWGYRGYK